MSQVVVIRGHLVDDRTTGLEQPVDRSASVAELRVSPSRGRPGEGTPEPPFTVDFLDRDKRAFPVDSLPTRAQVSTKSGQLQKTA